MEANITIISDLIKIGIPSLVALASTCISYYLAKQNQNKDIVIARMAIQGDVEKERQRRTGELIISIVSDISDMNEVFVKYGSRLSAIKSFFSENKLEIPAKYLKELNVRHRRVTEMIHLAMRVQSNVFMLHDQDVINDFSKFRESCSSFAIKYTPDCGCTENDIKNTLHDIPDNERKLLKKLRSMYMLEGLNETRNI